MQSLLLFLSAVVRQAGHASVFWSNRPFCFAFSQVRQTRSLLTGKAGWNFSSPSTLSSSLSKKRPEECSPGHLANIKHTDRKPAPKAADTTKARDPSQGLQAKKNALRFLSERFIQVGDYLFSRAVSSELSSAQVSLTSVFGMGTGGTSPSSTPTDLTESV